MSSIKKGNTHEVSSLIDDIPEFEVKMSASNIDARIAGKDSLIMVAHNDDNENQGFLIGHSIDSDIYYNWLIGVLPRFRREGVATLLMNNFKQHAVNFGHRKLQVKTLNRHRQMLHLLIALDYEVVKFDGFKITFEYRHTEQGDLADVYGMKKKNKSVFNS